MEIGTCGSGPAYAEEYGYNSAGQMPAKQVSVYKGTTSCGPVVMTANFVYDTEGKLTSVKYPAGTAVSQKAALTLNCAYDSMSRLTGASDMENPVTVNGCGQTPPASNGAVSWAANGSYNAAGQLTGVELLHDVSAGRSGTAVNFYNQAWQYNSMNQVTEIDTSAQSKGYPAGSSTPGLASYFFERYHFSATQNNGQIQSADDARLGASNTYTYDLLKRLTATTGMQSQTFAYDGFGNLTAKSVPAGSAEPVFPGVNSAKNRLNGATYDNNGNVTAFNGYGLSYDMENRLVSATTGSSTETYKYDAANHRVERITASGYDFVYFYGPNGEVLAEFQVLLQPGVSYYSSLIYEDVYFGGMLVGTTGGYAGSEHSSLVDRLGTGHPGYAYGTDIGTATGSGLMDFATSLNDSMTGFLYADQRWYSAGYGRFLTADLYGASANPENSQSWNRFAYVNGDAINRRDPSGLDPDILSTDPFCFSFTFGQTEASNDYDISCLFRRTGVTNQGAFQIDPDTNLFAHSLLRNRLNKAFAKPNCNSVFSNAINDYSLSDLRNAAKATNFYDVSVSSVGSLSQAQVSGNDNSTSLVNTISFGVDATTVNGPGQSAVLLGPNFYYNSVPSFQDSVLLHEVLHAYTRWNDTEVFHNFANYGLTQINPGSGDISTWLSTDCRFTPTSPK